MAEVKVQLGPADHGRRMSLVEFDRAETPDGYPYELARGVIVVSDVPPIQHGRQVEELHEQLVLYKRAHSGTITYVPSVGHELQVQSLRRQLARYEDAHEGVIFLVGTGSGCKLMVEDFESERHPDLLVYKTAPPQGDPQPWWVWLPDIVVEVVSPSSRQRDCEEKREEYLETGIREYWIVDAAEERMLALKRHGDRWREREIRSPEKYTTRQLPGFELDLAAVFNAAQRGG